MQRQFWVLLLFSVSLMLPGQGWTQEPPPPMSLEDQEAVQNIEKALGAIEDLERSVTKGTSAKKTQCMKAIGDPEFCECIGEKSPVGVTFTGYVSIAAGTKEEFKYDQLSAEDKEIFDATRAARDQCGDWKGKQNTLKPANQAR